MDKNELNKSRSEFEATEDKARLTRAWGFGQSADDYDDPYVQARWVGWQRALARSGLAANAGQAEPVAIMERFPDDQPASQVYTPVRPAWLGSVPPVGTKLYLAAPAAAVQPSEQDAKDALLKAMREQADRAYCQYIEQLNRDECKGFEHKLVHGKFSKSELDAHNVAAGYLAVHRALYQFADQHGAAAQEQSDTTKGQRDA